MYFLHMNPMNRYNILDSIMKDKNSSNTYTTFTFSHVTMIAILKKLRSINIRKTTGCDLIPGKLIKEQTFYVNLYNH